MEIPYFIRNAKEVEATRLSALAMRSKSHWKYPADYLAHCKPELTISGDYIKKWPVLVAYSSSRILGFGSLCVIKGEPFLDHLWVEPEDIGKGVGKKLFAVLVDESKKLGWLSFKIIADPQAEGFYLNREAVRIEMVPSKYMKGLFLPLLEYRL